MTARTTEQRFLAKVEKTDACWLWRGAKINTGYGHFWYEGRNVLSHRVAHLMFVGPIPDGMQVDHLCRVQACVNPAHLEAVTPRVNLLRNNSPTSIACRANTCQRGHPYTDENTNYYTDPRGRSYRRCRTCNRVRLRRDRKRAAA